MPTSSLLTCRHIHVFRGDRLVLHDLSVTLRSGEVLLLTGPNGVGKTTFLRVAAGLCPINSGHMERSGPVAWLGHHDALKPGLSLAENLHLDAQLGHNTLNKVLDALALTPLRHRPARLLSAGEKRRAALARVCLSRAPLWLLDEPGTGLDTSSMTRLGILMARHCAQGGSIIMTSHVPLPLEETHHIALHVPPLPENWP